MPARFNMDQHDGVGEVSHDALLYPIADGVGVLDAHLFWQGQVEVDVTTAPGLTAAQIVKAAMLRAALLDHSGGDGQLFLVHAVVQQGLEGLLQHGDRLLEDEQGDTDGNNGVKQIEVVAQSGGNPDTEQADGDPERGQYVSLQMQCIGGQGHGLFLLGYPVEVGGDAAVDQRREQHDQHTETDPLDRGWRDQFADGLEYYPAGCQQDQQRFDHTGDVFNFVMTVGVALVGGNIRFAYGHQRDQCRHQVHGRVNGLGNNTDGTAQYAGKYLHDNQGDIGAN